MYHMEELRCRLKSLKSVASQHILTLTHFRQEHQIKTQPDVKLKENYVHEYDHLAGKEQFTRTPHGPSCGRTAAEHALTTHSDGDKPKWQ